MRIDHIGIFVNDLEGVRLFFEKYFGARCNEPYHNPRTGLRSYFLRLDEGAAIEIMNRPDMEKVESPFYGHGLRHLSISVGSNAAVDEMTQRLSAEGYEVKSGPRTTGDGFYESVVVGPEDIQLEITV